MSYESKMMGSAGNAPVRHFRLCFLTPDLQSGSRITSLGGPTQVVGSGSGSHTHLQKFMRLLSVHWSSFPQLKLVESVGNAPTSTCLQSRCIACLPRPQNENGRLPPCCPEVLAHCHLCVLETRPRADAQPLRIGAAAGNCTRTIYLAGRHSAVKPQPRN